jgi:radical SAM protein with 4Fe4S-binding SPASM domain
MRTSAIIVKHFNQDQYTAIFSPKSGFFARIEDAGHDEVFWAKHGPELMDIAITNWCDRGCSFCYRKSDQFGAHISVADYHEIIRQAHSMHVFQVALGGGNPNQHPEFPEILRLTREDFGIVPSYTTNGRGLTGKVIEATASYCGAVAVSAYPPYEDTAQTVELLLDNGIKPNIHFILTSKSLGLAISWLDEPPAFLEKAGAIVFLNYKPVGRFADEGLLLNKNHRVKEFFEKATSGRRSFRVGFDTCSITGLARFGNAVEMSLEGCDAGRFSLFVSEKMEVFPCSYMVESGYKGVSLTGSTLLEIWKDSDLFREIRSRHGEKVCPECTSSQHCLSGCSLFPQINLCARDPCD